MERTSMERTSIWPLLLASVGVIVLAAIVLTAPDPRLATRQPGAGVSEVLRGRVVEVIEQTTPAADGARRSYSKLRVRVNSGSIEGTVLEVEERPLGPTRAIREFSPGDEVLVNYTRNPNGNDIAYIAEYVRTPQLAWLALIFAVAIGLVGGFQGLRSLLGMAISFVIILRFIIPHILNGENPVLISVLGALLVLVTTLYLSHGVNATTNAALAGTVVALILTGVLGQTFIG